MGQTTTGFFYHSQHHHYGPGQTEFKNFLERKDERKAELFLCCVEEETLPQLKQIFLTKRTIETVILTYDPYTFACLDKVLALLSFSSAKTFFLDEAKHAMPFQDHEWTQLCQFILSPERTIPRIRLFLPETCRSRHLSTEKQEELILACASTKNPLESLIVTLDFSLSDLRKKHFLKLLRPHLPRKDPCTVEGAWNVESVPASVKYFRQARTYFPLLLLLPVVPYDPVSRFLGSIE